MSVQLSDKQHVQWVIAYLVDMGVKDVVLSPGSRNAPFIISFTQHIQFTTYSIPDERVAAFIALGMAQQSRRPVVVCCTSGSAVLNYAPAIVEAYYQKIPLIVITADRPEYLIDNGAGQSMQQQNVYANYCKASYHLSEAHYNPAQSIPAIANLLQQVTYPDAGPVHLNVALQEPLYGQSEVKLPQVAWPSIPIPVAPNLSSLHSAWRQSTKKLILVGMQSPNAQLQAALLHLAKDPSVVVWTENLANVSDPAFHPCIDRLMATFNDDDRKAFVPEVLVTLGDAIVSKWIKKWWRALPPTYHFNITPGALQYDMFGCLTETIVGQPIEVLTTLAGEKRVSSNYAAQWQQREAQAKKGHKDYLRKIAWSDLLVFDHLLRSLPADSDLQLANSTPVRYAQLFEPRMDISYFSNRGVSGIDGTISTAVGAALRTDRLVTVVTGDLGFFYDSNALWHNYWPENLRIILINNGGGNIFRYIAGPDTTDALETYFEGRHTFDADHIAKAFGLRYAAVEDEKALSKGLSALYANQDPIQLLEVKTPGPSNALLLRQYFDHLKAYR